MYALRGQVVSATPAITTVTVPVVKLKRVVGTSRRLACPVTAALAKAVPSTLIVPLTRSAVSAQNASKGTLVPVNPVHLTSTVPAVRSAAVKSAKVDPAASVNRVEAMTTAIFWNTVAKGNVQT